MDNYAIKTSGDFFAILLLVGVTKRLVKIFTGQDLQIFDYSKHKCSGVSTFTKSCLDHDRLDVS